VSSARIVWRVFRGGLRLALCYVIALQAMIAAYGTAFAVGAVSNISASFAICHGVSLDAPSDPGDDAKPADPCALCATVAFASGLPPCAASTADIRFAVTHRQPVYTTALVSLSAPRAALARAPPRFV
jgi:hypothetical protein